MDVQQMYELVYEATAQAVADAQGTEDIRLSPRMSTGTVTFTDDEGREVKTVEAVTFFKKVTSVREKLRVLEQKINGHPSLSLKEQAELQAYLTRAYGSLTTFNFLFQDEDDKFKGQSSR